MQGWTSWGARMHADVGCEGAAELSADGQDREC